MKQSSFLPEQNTKTEMTHAEYLEKYRQLKERANKIENSVRNRMKKLCKESGLDPDLLGIHPHNAMVSYNAGHPWKGINYSLVRKIQWLEREKLFQASRIVEIWSKKNDPFYTRNRE